MPAFGGWGGGGGGRVGAVSLRYPHSNEKIGESLLSVLFSVSLTSAKRKLEEFLNYGTVIVSKNSID